MLTPEQEEEARILYIRSQLPMEEMEHWTKLDSAREELAAAKEAYAQLQAQCSHPLLLREHINEGSSGHWDRDSSYWTRHICHMCDKRWSTNQSWQRVGGKHGHPDDEEAQRDA